MPQVPTTPRYFCDAISQTGAAKHSVN